MKDKFGDLFTTKAKIIGHGVNCQGAMGAGIAKAFKEKYPENFKRYKGHCDSGDLTPGGLVYGVDIGLIILNFASQNKIGPDARYDWLFSSLYRGGEFVLDTRVHETMGTTIAIPEIGCGIGGLEWRKASLIVTTVEQMLDNKIEFEVWHYGANPA